MFQIASDQSYMTILYFDCNFDLAMSSHVWNRYQIFKIHVVLLLLLEPLKRSIKNGFCQNLHLWNNLCKTTFGKCALYVGVVVLFCEHFYHGLVSKDKFHLSDSRHVWFTSFILLQNKCLQWRIYYLSDYIFLLEQHKIRYCIRFKLGKLNEVVTGYCEDIYNTFFSEIQGFETSNNQMISY